MQKPFELIKEKFAGKLIGNLAMQRIVCETLFFFPEKIVDQVTRDVWFFSSYDEAWAFTFDSQDLGKRHLIFLSDDLLVQHRDQKMFTIAHEIGHVVLGHRNAILEHQTKSETSHQEKEADHFVKKFLPQVFSSQATP